MKNIKNKFKINIFTYLLFFFAFCSGYFKNTILLFGIVLFHEIGHICFIHHFEYKIEKVEIYPFGGITSVSKPINTPIKKEIMIALGGILFQIVLIPIFLLLHEKGWILENTYSLFQNYNKVIMIFNLLPITPLDGSKIVHSILEYFFPYEKAYNLYIVGTIIAFFLFACFHALKSLNNYMILMFLLFKAYEAIRERKYCYNKFYLERYLYEFPYQRVESHLDPNIKKLKKDTLHFFWNKDRYIHEKELLKKRFKLS